MAIDIQLMRRNWRIVQRFWLEVDGWSDAEVEEARVAIKQCSDIGDSERLECWFNYLAALVESIKSNPEALSVLGNDRNSHGSATV